MLTAIEGKFHKPDRRNLRRIQATLSPCTSRVQSEFCKDPPAWFLVCRASRACTATHEAELPNQDAPSVCFLSWETGSCRRCGRGPRIGCAGHGSDVYRRVIPPAPDHATTPGAESSSRADISSQAMGLASGRRKWASLSASASAAVHHSRSYSSATQLSRAMRSMRRSGSMPERAPGAEPRARCASPSAKGLADSQRLQLVLAQRWLHTVETRPVVDVPVPAPQGVAAAYHRETGLPMAGSRHVMNSGIAAPSRRLR